jgi:hypothetical protein
MSPRLGLAPGPTPPSHQGYGRGVPGATGRPCGATIQPGCRRMCCAIHSVASGQCPWASGSMSGVKELGGGQLTSVSWLLHPPADDGVPAPWSRRRQSPQRQSRPASDVEPVLRHQPRCRRGDWTRYPMSAAEGRTGARPRVIPGSSPLGPQPHRYVLHPCQRGTELLDLLGCKTWPAGSDTGAELQPSYSRSAFVTEPTRTRPQPTGTFQLLVAQVRSPLGNEAGRTVCIPNRCSLVASLASDGPVRLIQTHNYNANRPAESDCSGGAVVSLSAGILEGMPYAHDECLTRDVAHVGFSTCRVAFDAVRTDDVATIAVPWAVEKGRRAA